MLPADLQALLEQIDACERDAERVVNGLNEAAVNESPPGGGWSVAQCLSHLTLMNDFYLRGWPERVAKARADNIRPFAGLRPTPIGRWFVHSLEPPAKLKAKAIASVTPSPAVPLAGLVEAYRASHDTYRALVRDAAHVDVNRLVQRNPIATWAKMRLSTVLLIVPAHDRRHLWQAAQVLPHLRRR